MIRRIVSICALVAAAAFSRGAGPPQGALQQRIGEIRASIARNQTRLKQYAWTETIEISLKGEVKKRDQNACTYGPDGKVQKTAIGEAADSQSGRRGPLRRRIVDKKVAELKDYMDRVGSLMRRYMPPDPQTMRTALQSGRALLDPASGAVVFSGYVKPGDKVTLIFDPAAKVVRSFAVATWLDQEKDAVTLNAGFSRLPDGTAFLEQSNLVATAKQIQIKTTNFGYHKVID